MKLHLQVKRTRFLLIVFTCINLFTLLWLLMAGKFIKLLENQVTLEF